MRSFFRRLWRLIAGVDYKTHRRCSLELLVSLVCATIPFWFGAFVLLLISKKDQDFALYLALLRVTNEHAELLIIGPSLLAPVFLLLFEGFPPPKGSRGSIGTLIAFAFVLTLFLAAAFALQTAQIVPHVAFLRFLSTIGLVISCVLLYFYLLQNDLAEDVAHDIIDDEEKFVKKVTQTQ